MSDKEWFSGRSVGDDLPFVERYAPHRLAAVIFVLVLALLGVAGAAIWVAGWRE